jgi:hypothetical protein
MKDILGRYQQMKSLKQERRNIYDLKILAEDEETPFDIEPTPPPADEEPEDEEPSEDEPRFPPQTPGETPCGGTCH